VHEHRRIARFETFEDYWRSFESGVGMLPHAYRGLTEPDRRIVRRRVERRLRPDRSGDGLDLMITVQLAVGHRPDAPT